MSSGDYAINKLQALRSVVAVYSIGRESLQWRSRKVSSIVRFGKAATNSGGGMDASQYKDYVLVLLFVKYVSDKYAGQPDALIEVPAGGSFAGMVALKGRPPRKENKQACLRQFSPRNCISLGFGLTLSAALA